MDGSAGIVWRFPQAAAGNEMILSFCDLKPVKKIPHGKLVQNHPVEKRKLTFDSTPGQGSIVDRLRFRESAIMAEYVPFSAGLANRLPVMVAKSVFLLFFINSLALCKEKQTLVPLINTNMYNCLSKC